MLGGVLILRDVVRILCIFFFCPLYIHLYLVHGSRDHLTYIVLIFFYILMYVFQLPFHMLFLFSLYAHAFYYLYAIFYFCFTLRCLDEFCLKYFRNIGCQSLLAIVRYHLKEFSDCPPKNEHELFNLCYSSLRTAIEQGFGVLKKRFRVLDAEPFWSFEIQVEVVLACCVIHNYIMGVDHTKFLNV